jgi:hypothetical protein
VLDIQLFDIAALVAAGYDDASRPTVPLVVTYPQTSAPRPQSSPGPRVTRGPPSVGGAAVTADQPFAAALWDGLIGKGNVVTTLDAGIKKIWLPARGGSTWKRVTLRTGWPPKQLPAATT